MNAQAVPRGNNTSLSEPRWELGDITFLIESRRLQVGEKVLALRPQQYELLTLLCEYGGRVLSNDEAISHLWGDHPTAGSHDLQCVVFELRNLFGKERRGYIANVPRVGYRLAVLVHQVASEFTKPVTRNVDTTSKAADTYFHPSGRFEREGKIWKEYGNDVPGRPIYVFCEHWRDDEFIYLFDETRRQDPGRVMYLRLPIEGGAAQWSFPNPISWEDLVIVKPHYDASPPKRPRERLQSVMQRQSS